MPRQMSTTSKEKEKVKRRVRPSINRTARSQDILLPNPAVLIPPCLDEANVFAVDRKATGRMSAPSRNP
eukprot:2324460-Amphidinium_carterae.1